MHRTGGASEVVDFIEACVDRERLDDIVIAHLEPRIAKEMGDIAFDAREIVVQAENRMASFEQAFT